MLLMKPDNKNKLSMKKNTMDNSKMANFQALVLIHGLMEEYMLDISRMKKCMKKEYLHGLMVLYMMVSILMI